MAELLYKSALEQIVTDVNAKNTDTLYTPLTTSNVKVTHVAVVEASSGKSTCVLTPITNDYESPTPALSYVRYLATRLFPSGLEIGVANNTPYKDIFKKLADKYNLPPFVVQDDSTDSNDAYDFTKATGDTVYTTTSGQATTVLNIDFAANSAAYIGTLKVTITDTTKDLGTSVTVTDLDVLVYPSGGSVSIKKF